MSEGLAVAVFLAIVTVSVIAFVQGTLRARTRKARLLGVLLAVAMAAGIIGPYLTGTGISKVSGERREYAEQALVQAHIALDSPVQRIVLGPHLRIVQVRSLPPGTPDHLGTGECKYEVVVQAFGAFWLPYRRVYVKCGISSVSLR